MNTSRHSLAYASVIAIVATVSSAAQADDDTKQLEEVTVTATPDSAVHGYAAKKAFSATKSDVPVLETPVAVQVVPQEVIADQHRTSILDAVQNVSGIQSPPGGYYDNTYIRGFATVTDTYRNGLKLNSTRGVPDMAFIDQIEVAKGPSSILYGRVQPGGVVNTVTKKPQANAAYSLIQEVGSWDSIRTVIDATGAISTDHSLMYRLIGVYDRGDSYIDFQQHVNKAVAASFSWLPSSRFELNMQLEGYDKKATNVAYTAQQIPAVGNRPANVSRNWTQNDPVMWNNFPVIERTSLFSYDWTFAIDDAWKLTNRLAYSDLDDVMSMMTATAYSDATGQVSRRVSHNSVRRHALTTNLELSGNFATGDIKHNILIGFDYLRHRTAYKGLWWATGAAVPGIDLNSPTYGNVSASAIQALIDPTIDNVIYYQNMNDKGLYVQDQMSIGDRWKLLLGGRQDETFDPVTKVSGTSTAACFPNCDGALRPDTPTERAFSPRAGLLYKVSDSTSLYGSYAKSFGSSNSSALTFDGSRPDPQSGVQYELGAKASLLDDKVTTSITLFDLYQRNRMTPDLDHTGYSVPLGEIRSRGVEIDAAGQISEHVSLIGSYTYDDARITKDNTSGAKGTQGNRLSGVPLNAASFWAKYDTAPESDEGWSLGAGAYLNGQRQGNNAGAFQLPGYVRIDALLAYRTKLGGKTVKVHANVRNLLDKWYFEATDGSTNAYYGAPRSITLSLAVDL